MKKRIRIWIYCVSIGVLLSACGTKESDNELKKDNYVKVEPQPVDESELEPLQGETEFQEDSSQVNTESVATQAPYEYFNTQGMTLESRIHVPEGYERTSTEAGSLTKFLRTYPLKVHDSAVLLYDGSEKWNQDAHVAVFQLPIEERDLQQCADSVMRVYAEYYFQTEQYEKIRFHFTNGFLAEYGKWRDGYRISVEGNNVSWVKSASYDDSYETFVKFMRMVFTYAGTLSMEQESTQISVKEARVGDVILKGGSPGHVVMIVDMCENEQGEKAFLLAQGYMPAQEFHVLKNPLHEESPWYYEAELTESIRTPEYGFGEGCLKRLSY
ncbi:MAG: DUF4846 domain-containing protein [Lachnospiraceae bacterium]|nr:DUF4846 domain-containing protein [Lachnospiraceae bacterium]